MVEIEGLKVIISAEVKAAIENMQKMQAQIKKTEDITKKMKEKEEAALKKWKAGWVGISTAALASLYALAKTSAYMSMWFEEATGTIQYFSDSAMEPLSPIVEEVNNILWKLGDAFAGLPAPVRGAVGAILLIAGALGGILTTLALVDMLFKTTFATNLLTYLGTALTSLLTWAKGAPAAILSTMEFGFAQGGIAAGLALLASILLGFAAGLIAVDFLDRTGFLTWLDNAGRNLEKQIPNVFNLVKILTAPLGALGATVINIVRGEFDRILPDITRIFEDTMRSAFEISPHLFEAIYKIPAQMMPTTQTDERGFGGSWQTGTAFVPSTGLYTLHRGESVIPRGKSTSEGSNTINFNPTVNITGTTINSAMDIRQLAAQLTSYWRDDLQRYSRLGVT